MKYLIAIVACWLIFSVASPQTLPRTFSDLSTFKFRMRPIRDRAIELGIDKGGLVKLHDILRALKSFLEQERNQTTKTSTDEEIAVANGSIAVLSDYSDAIVKSYKGSDPQLLRLRKSVIELRIAVRDSYRKAAKSPKINEIVVRRAAAADLADMSSKLEKSLRLIEQIRWS